MRVKREEMCSFSSASILLIKDGNDFLVSMHPGISYIKEYVHSECAASRNKLAYPLTI